MHDILPDQDTPLVFDHSKLKSVDLWSAAVKYDPGARWMESAVTPPPEFRPQIVGGPKERSPQSVPLHVN